MLIEKHIPEMSRRNRLFEKMWIPEIAFLLAVVTSDCFGVPAYLNRNLQSRRQCSTLATSGVNNVSQCPIGCFKDVDKCYKCPVLSYKDDLKDTTCHLCGTNSVNNYNHTECRCKEKHFRKVEHKQRSDKPCLDTLPKGLAFKIVDDYFLTVTWSGIQEELEVGNISYTLECLSCLPEEYFRITTRKNVISLIKPVTHKFYKVKLTTSYIDPTTHLHVIVHVTEDHVFIGTESESESDRTIIIIISVLIPCILTFLITIGLTYIAQRRRKVYFQRKLVSLKRKARPPKPPPSESCLLSQYNSRELHQEELTENEEPDYYTIKPYAVLNFKPFLEKYDMNATNKSNKSELQKMVHDEIPSKEADDLPQYVTMDGRGQKKLQNKPKDLPYRQQCLPNEYITREYLTPREQPPTQHTRPRPMSWYLREMAMNEMNYNNIQIQSRAQSGIIYEPNMYNSPNYGHHYPRPMQHMGYSGNSGYFPQMEDQVLQRHQSDLFMRRTVLENQARFNKQDIGQSVWPLGMHGRVRTQTSLDQNQDRNNSRYLQQKAAARRNFVPYPPAFYNEEDIFEEYPIIQPTPRIEQRGRSRTVMCPNEGLPERRGRSRTVMEPDEAFHDFAPRQRSRTTLAPPDPFLLIPHLMNDIPKSTVPSEPNNNNLTALDQIKLVGKYKRTESKEKLCVADYVKLKRPHSADDINKVYGIE
eukprot:TCONS_00023104-protein